VCGSLSAQKWGQVQQAGLHRPEVALHVLRLPIPGIHGGGIHRLLRHIGLQYIAAIQQRRVGLLGFIELDRELGVLQRESEKGGELVGLGPLSQLAQPRLGRARVAC